VSLLWLAAKFVTVFKPGAEAGPVAKPCLGADPDSKGEGGREKDGFCAGRELPPVFRSCAKPDPVAEAEAEAEAEMAEQSDPLRLFCALSELISSCRAFLFPSFTKPSLCSSFFLLRSLFCLLLALRLCCFSLFFSFLRLSCSVSWFLVLRSLRFLFCLCLFLFFLRCDSLEQSPTGRSQGRGQVQKEAEK
jgi:hypothetical protein